MRKINNIIDLKIKKRLHPVLEKALYVVPRRVQRDAWWLVDDLYTNTEIKGIENEQ